MTEESKHRHRPKAPVKALVKSRPMGSTKTATIAHLLSRSKGASMAELQSATGWQPHSIRAALSGLRKRGVTVTRSQTDKGASVYRIGAGR